MLQHGFTDLQKGYHPPFYFPLEAQSQIADYYDLHASNHFWLTCGARLRNLRFEEDLRNMLNTVVQEAEIPVAPTSPGAKVNSVSVSIGDGPHDEPRKNRPVSDIETADESKFQVILIDASRGIGASNQYLGRNLSIPMIMSGILLLVSCLNLAGLHFSRNFHRIRELNIRAALGASRRRLIRQFMTETLILTVAGTLNGIVLSILSYKWLNLHFVRSIESIDSTPDIRIFAMLAVLVAICTLLVGLYPTLRVTRLHHNLHLNYRAGVSSQSFRMGKVAIATQIICAISLIYAAFLYGKTLVNLYQTDVGFDKTSLLVFTLQGEESYREIHPGVDIRQEILKQINSIPGVEKGAYSNMRLLSNWTYSTKIAMSQFEPTSDEMIEAYQIKVSPVFFTTLGIPLKEGDGFDRQVEARNADKVIISESFARRISPDASVIGRTLANNEHPLQIIGVCGDIHYHSVREASDYIMFFPTIKGTGDMVSFALSSSYFYVRTRMPPLSLSKTIVDKVTQSHSDIFIENIETLEMNIDDLVSSERNLSVLSILFSSISVLLICIGLFALVSFDVSTRTQEIGVRLALGANRKKIMRYVLKRALAPLIPGLVVGVPLAIFLKRYIEGDLYHISGFEPVGLTLASLLVGLTALLAALIPSIRSTKLNPATVLKSE